MQANDLANFILADSARIAEAISTGAGWEVWFQVDLVLRLRASGLQAAREVPYAPGSQQRLDLLCQDAAGIDAIELKVESATNAGAAIIGGIRADVAKLGGYAMPGPGNRWVVGVGYSAACANAMADFANDPANHAVRYAAGGLCLLIVLV